MKYDLSDKLIVDKFKRQCDKLIEKGAKVDLTEKRKRISIPQNAYLHLILSWFAIETGYTLEQVKQDVFKRLVNRSEYVEQKDGITICKSINDFKTNEIASHITKFRNWASSEMNIYLPSSEERGMLEQLENRLETLKHYL